MDPVLPRVSSGGLCAHSCLLSIYKTSLSSSQLDVFDAAERYQQAGLPLIVLAGKEYGSGSSRDWAAKGPFLLVRMEQKLPCGATQNWGWSPEGAWE